MDERIIRFISALRSAGVRVSLAESADAFNAVEMLGIKDRETFRMSMRATLVKDAQDIPTFEELFPFFFDTAAPSPLLDLTQDLTPDEIDMLAQALREFNARLRQALERLLRGEALSQEELDRLGKMVGLNQMDDMRYREWMAQRMQRALGNKEIQQAIQELAELLSEMGMDKNRLEQLRQLLLANQQAINEQLRQYAGGQIAENMSEQPPDPGIENLLDRPFSSLTDKDMERLRKEVQRLANMLRTRIALRQKHAKSGQLDAKGTLRANLKHNNVPIIIKHRDRTLKPKLVVICDVSTSMRFCSELMLSLVYGLQDQIHKTHAFAFIDHIEYISPDFAGKDIRQAVVQVLARMPSGYYNTDLGYSLVSFTKEYLDTIDNRTTLIMVGDGRNNYNNPRTDLFSALARRSRRTIWLTPEPMALWGTGDSDMLRYLPACDVTLQVSTLAELISAIDKLLTAG